MDVTGLLESLERAGGYAALTGLILVGIFWLTRSLIAQQAQRSLEREREMQQRHQRELDRECANAAEHREDKTMLVQVVQENSRAQTALVGAVERLTDTQERTNDRLVAIDRHLGLRPATSEARKGGANG